MLARAAEPHAFTPPMTPLCCHVTLSGDVLSNFHISRFNFSYFEPRVKASRTKKKANSALTSYMYGAIHFFITDLVYRPTDPSLDGYAPRFTLTFDLVDESDAD